MHHLGLFIDDPLNFMHNSMLDFVINLHKELTQNIYSSEYITILILIHKPTELIFKRYVFASQLLKILLFEVLLCVIIVDVSFEEFACALLLVDVFDCEEDDDQEDVLLNVLLATHEEHLAEFGV